MHTEESGSIYILTNQAMPGLVKIGRTSKSPSNRAAELSRPTGVPEDFDVLAVYSMGIQETYRAETYIHQQLEIHRANQDREFFCLSGKAAKRLVEQILQELGIRVEQAGANNEFDFFAFDTSGISIEDLNPTGNRKLGVEHGRKWPMTAERAQCEAVLRLDRSCQSFSYLMRLYVDIDLQLPGSTEYIIGFFSGVKDAAWDVERRIQEWEEERLREQDERRIWENERNE